jgi:ABC-type transport system involved in cytochrome c biogenesis permease subunit
MASQQTELNFLYLACLLYAVFGLLCLSRRLANKYHKPLILLALSALLIHAISIGIRWVRIDHGPFINMYEILTSNVWSISVGLTLFFIFLKDKSIVFRFVTPVLFIMMLWLITTPPTEAFLPPTYNTIWLYFHVFSGKFFFTLLILSSALAAQSLLLIHQGSDNDHIQDYTDLAYKFLAIAFVFETFMLIFGSIWAQDAWGRYWSWDPLETWAFVTWLGVAFTLHLQVNSKKDRPFLYLILVCFILAFLTFYGVPFVSLAPHKGMI